MNINLNNTQINTLQNKSRLYSYLGNTMGTTYFRVGDGKFTFGMTGAGAVETTVDVDTPSDEIISFRFDYSKWQTMLQKFSIYNTVTLTIGEGELVISTPESSDHATYSITDNDVEFIVDDLKNSNFDNSATITVTDEIVSNFELMNSMFSIQSSGNSIGVNRKNIIYADGTVVLKTILNNPIPESFFTNTEDDNVFVGTNLIKVISMLYKNNRDFTFNNDYTIVYWHDEDTELIYTGELQASELPSDEEFESYKPSTDVHEFTITAKTLKEAINFFNGVYEGSEWKPLKFNFSSENGLVIKYESASTHLTKHIDGVTCDTDIEFILSSDTLKNIVTKIYDRFTGDAEITMIYNANDIGVYLTSSDVYETVLVKLEDF